MAHREASYAALESRPLSAPDLKSGADRLYRLVFEQLTEDAFALLPRPIAPVVIVVIPVDIPAVAVITAGVPAIAVVIVAANVGAVGR
jgi:hypothetical protein